MRKTLLIISVLFISVGCYAASDQEKTTTPLEIKVGYVTDAHAPPGCGCLYYWPTDEISRESRGIFSSVEDKEAWMHLNGKDVKLKLVKSTQSEKNSTKGGRFHEIYRYKNMTIRIDYLVTWTCEADDPESESCEVTYYDLNIMFTRQGRKKTISAKGACGC